MPKSDSIYCSYIHIRTDLEKNSQRYFWPVSDTKYHGSGVHISTVTTVRIKYGEILLMDLIVLKKRTSVPRDHKKDLVKIEFL